METSVIDQDVNATKFRDGFRDCRIYCVFVGDIALQCDCLDPLSLKFCYRIICAVHIDFSNDDRRTLAAKYFCERIAKAHCATGNKCNFASMSHGVPLDE